MAIAPLHLTSLMFESRSEAFTMSLSKIEVRALEVYHVQCDDIFMLASCRLWWIAEYMLMPRCSAIMMILFLPKK